MEISYDSGVKSSQRIYSPKRRQPGSPRLPTASFSIMSRKSSILSGLISASTHTTNGLELRAEEEDIFTLELTPKEGFGEKEEAEMGRLRAKMKVMIVFRLYIVLECDR